MDILKKFGTDRDLESEKGVTLDFGDGCKVRIHRAGGSNRKYQKTAARVLKPFRHQIQTNTLDEATAVKAYAEIYVDSVILGWEGVEMGGKPVPFEDRDAAISLLVAAPEFLNAIRIEAENAATFRDVEAEADAGN